MHCEILFIFTADFFLDF